MTRSTTTAAPAAAPVETDDWAAQIERLRNRKPAERFLTIPDPDCLAALAEARDAWVEARKEARRALPDAGNLSAAEVDAFLAEDPAVVARLADLNDVVTAAEAAEITFHFRALPPDIYDGMEAQHPSEDENQDYDPDTYVPALISACSVKPITPEQVSALIHDEVDPEDGKVIRPAPFNLGDIGAMLQMCRDVNEQPRMMLGKGSRPTPT